MSLDYSGQAKKLPKIDIATESDLTTLLACARFDSHAPEITYAVHNGGIEGSKWNKRGEYKTI